jgi:hypothetical protein
MLAPDTLHGGSLNEGIVGRVYLVTPDSKTSHDSSGVPKEIFGVPFITSGSLQVDLFDHTPRGNDEEPKAIERWIFDAETLSKFEKTDTFGPGYSLFLPWSRYGPDITKILMQAQFTPSDGREPLFCQSGVIAIDHRLVHKHQTRPKPNSQAILSAREP